jgi:hypothetical protein
VLTTALGILLSLIFLGLSLLHWHWVVAGTEQLSGFVPEVDGRPAFTPGRLATSIVAVLLLLAAATCASQAHLPGVPGIPMARLGVWTLCILFLLRAIGDFRLVGFFKRVRTTRFARLDTLIYSPLCLTLAGLCAALLYSSK